jgi:hypothetical protein
MPARFLNSIQQWHEARRREAPRQQQFNWRFPDDYLEGATIFITDGPGDGDERTITAYDGDTDTATVSAAWSTNLTSASKYEVKKNRIGTGNYIWLTTDGTVPTPVNLPPSWSDTVNEIWVDGDRKQSGD